MIPRVYVLDGTTLNYRKQKNIKFRNACDVGKMNMSSTLFSVDLSIKEIYTIHEHGFNVLNCMVVFPDFAAGSMMQIRALLRTLLVSGIFCNHIFEGK